MWRVCLGDAFAIALSKVLPTCRDLRHLCLQTNEIADPGAEAIAGCLANTTVTVLRLDRNHIGNNGALMFLDAIRSSIALACLVLCHNKVDEARKQCLELAWHDAKKPCGRFSKHWHTLSSAEQIQFSTEELEKYGGL